MSPHPHIDRSTSAVPPMVTLSCSHPNRVQSILRVPNGWKMLQHSIEKDVPYVFRLVRPVRWIGCHRTSTLHLLIIIVELPIHSSPAYQSSSTNAPIHGYSIMIHDYSLMSSSALMSPYPHTPPNNYHRRMPPIHGYSLRSQPHSCHRTRTSINQHQQLLPMVTLSCSHPNRVQCILRLTVHLWIPRES